MKIAIVAAGFTPARGRPAAPRHGDLQARRHDRHVPRQDDRRHDRARLSTRFRRALLQPDRGLRRIRLSGKPCRELRAAGLCLGLAEMPLSGRLRRALLNSQPMGFYAPAQIVRDVREHGVEVRPVDVNHSDWDARWSQARARRRGCTPLHRDMADDIRATHALRLGFRQIKGLSEEARQADRRSARRAATLRCAISGCAPDCRSHVHRTARRCRRLRLARPHAPPGAVGGARRSAASATSRTICRCFAPPVTIGRGGSSQRRSGRARGPASRCRRCRSARRS